MKPGCAALFAALLTSVVVMHAQDEGLRLSPLFGLTEARDTNLFFSATQPESDRITRISPGLESKYSTPLVRWMGRLSLDAERFASHPDLSNADARQQATTTLAVKTSERTTVSADADFVRTHTPGELNQLSGLNLTRVRATRATAHAGIERRVDAVTTVAGDYTFADSAVASGIGIRSQTGTLRLTRRLSARDSVRAGYRLEQSSFAPVTIGVAAETAHALVAGWTHEVSPRASFSIDAGPRVTNGSTGADLAARLFYRTPKTAATVEYSSTQGTVLGVAGVVDIQRIAATATWHPWRSMAIELAPAAYRTSLAPLRADVLRGALHMSQALNDRLAIEISIDGTVQRGNLIPALSQQTIDRRETLVRFVVTAPKVKRSSDVD